MELMKLRLSGFNPTGKVSFPSGVNGGVNDLLTYIQSNPGQKTDEIKQALQIPQRTLERYLKKLRDTNRVEFRGSAKTGGYFPILFETE
jgi:ATP-dependent DNA helicase RecG